MVKKEVETFAKRPQGVSKEQWAEGEKATRLLCSIATVVDYRTDKNYQMMPCAFKLFGVSIEFLPHWDHCLVGDLELNVPKGEEEVLSAVAAIITLKTLGYNPDK